MKIHFVFAPTVKRSKHSSLPEHTYPPLGILYLAGYIRKYESDLLLKATDGLLLGFQETFNEISRFGAEVIFISFITPCAQGAYALAQKIKEHDPSVVIVMGGPHATALPHEALSVSPCDIVVRGEGEQTSLELVRALLHKNSLTGIDGISWKHKGEVITNKPRSFIANLDDIPIPARDLVNMDDYRGWFVTKNTPETSLLSSRGCPFDCTFCSNIIWKSSKPWLRLRSPKNIVDEMEHLKMNYSIGEVFDNGDEFNNNPAHGIAVCKELISRRLSITWKAQLRAFPLPEELVKLMAEAGCWYVHLGIESGNQRTLDGIRKHITLEQVEEACKLLNKYKIKVFGLFMLYNVWDEDGLLQYENTEDTLKTIEFGKKMVDKGLLSYISSTIATPYPGSELYEIAKTHSLFQDGISNEWERWLTEEDFIMELPGVTRKAASNIYFRASILRARCYLRSGNWKMKDIPLFANKGLHAISIKLGSIFHK